MPAVFDRETGEKIAFTYDKKKGGHVVFTSNEQIHVGGATYQLRDGVHLANEVPNLVDDEQLIFGKGTRLAAMSVASKHEVTTKRSRLGKTKTTKLLIRETLFNAVTSVNVRRVLLKTQDHIVTALGEEIHLFDVEDLEAYVKTRVTPRRTFALEHEVFDAIVADRHLFVTTMSGQLTCYGNASSVRELTALLTMERP